MTDIDESHHEKLLEEIKSVQAERGGGGFDPEKLIALFRKLDVNEAELEKLETDESIHDIRRAHELGIVAVDLLAEISEHVGFDIHAYLINDEVRDWVPIDVAR